MAGKFKFPHLHHVIQYWRLYRIKNPLAGLSKETLLRDVDEFAAEHNLQDIKPQLIKGALVAQNPDDFQDLQELDQTDKDALQYEVDHKWSHPTALYITIIICSLGAAVQG